MKPVVVLIGRPNVGKSTLFNRLTRSKEALVDDLPGVTRDRHYCDAKWNDVQFTLVDTGGFLETDENVFAREIRFQVAQAITEADLVIVVLDGKGGLSPFDVDLVESLRQIETPVFHVVNKIDGEEQEKNLSDFYQLGISELFPVSGEHGYGVPDFMDEMVARLPLMEPEETTDMIQLAVVGRPNVGKSSLINQIIGQKRLVVSDIPGTTRDAIDSIVTVKDKNYNFIDTAGIRRKSRVLQKLEKFSVIKTLKCLDRCDVALIMIDATEGITDQDVTIAGYAYERACGCIFLLNKWDIVEKDAKTAQRFYERLQMEAKFLNFAPVLTLSAKTGLRIGSVFKLADQVYEQFGSRIPTGRINRIIEAATLKTVPSLHKGKRLKFYYATQVSTKPPTFVCFVNFPGAVHFSYHRYLINQIREHTGLDQTPIRLLFRLRTGKIEFPTSRKGGRNKGARDRRKSKKTKRTSK